MHMNYELSFVVISKIVYIVLFKFNMVDILFILFILFKNKFQDLLLYATRRWIFSMQY